MRDLKLQKLFNSKKTAAAAYAAAAFLFGIYAFAEMVPGFFLSTAGRLVLLCGCCAFMWCGGAVLTKIIGNNGPMQMNLRIYLGLFLLLFATLTLFDPLWGRNGGFVNWTKELFRVYTENSLNLVPFRTIGSYLAKGTYKQLLVNIAGNIVCLMPLGILLPLCFEKQKKALVFLISCAGISAGVEILQFITLSGSCDVDDLILNAGGAFLMFGIARIKYIDKILRRILLLEKGDPA